MTVALKRLQSILDDIALVNNSQKKIWQFTSNLAKKEKNFFAPLVRNHPVLNLEYSVICTRLAHYFSRPTANFQELEEQLITALAMAELLIYINQHYLKAPHELSRLKDEQKIYRSLLKKHGYQFSKNTTNEEYFSLTRKIRDTTFELNWSRLFGVRTRRLIITLVPLANNIPDFCKVVDFADQFAGPFFNHVAWLFYVPRLAVNLSLLLKHLFLPLKKERELDWMLRLEAQLQRRGFEVANDLVWLSVGILGTFVLVGPLAPIGMYLTVGAFLFDFVMASLRAYIEIDRLNKLRDAYAQQKLNTLAEDCDEQDDYLKFLEKRIYYEKVRLLVNVVSTGALFLAMCLAIPALAFNPYIPFISAAIIIAITLVTYLTVQLLESKRPSDRVDNLLEKERLVYGKSPYALFQQPTRKNSHLLAKENELENIPSGLNALQ